MLSNASLMMGVVEVGDCRRAGSLRDAAALCRIGVGAEESLF